MEASQPAYWAGLVGETVVSFVLRICRFQNLSARIVPVSCERAAYPSLLSSFSKCADFM